MPGPRDPQSSLDNLESMIGKLLEAMSTQTLLLDRMTLNSDVLVRLEALDVQLQGLELNRIGQASGAVPPAAPVAAAVVTTAVTAERPSVEINADAARCLANYDELRSSLGRSTQSFFVAVQRVDSSLVVTGQAVTSAQTVFVGGRLLSISDGVLGQRTWTIDSIDGIDADRRPAVELRAGGRLIAVGRWLEPIDTPVPSQTSY